MTDKPPSGGLASPLSGPASNLVTYSFLPEETGEDFLVAGFEGDEKLGRPYRYAIDLEAVDDVADAGELLGQSATFVTERQGRQRTVHGIVARVALHRPGRIGQTSSVELVPALVASQYTTTTRIFQDVSALEVVETVLAEDLGRYGRRVDMTALDQSRYLTRDYCVQYQESNFDFVHRLLEEEGVGYYFRQEECETVTLFDNSRNLTPAETIGQGPVRFELHGGLDALGSETVLQFSPELRLAPTAVTVRDHDWTRGRPTLEQSGADDVPPSPGLVGEVYEHGHGRSLNIHEDEGLREAALATSIGSALPNGMPPGLDRMVHDLPGAVLGLFSTSDLDSQASIRQELLHRGRRTYRGTGLVTGFTVGHTFQLVGHPTLSADGDYLLTKVTHSSRPDAELEGAAGHGYHNRFECIPLATPWRPERVTPKPVIHSVQTARVTGPAGMDVYADPHGRILVRFHWDKAQPNPTGKYTCWIRVSQAWAGQGAPGFLFIPRVGMEVVVSFVDGDPDRPLVMGCVYNGENPTPGLLPIQATKSILRTRTVPHGLGHNELSFEDAMGMERVHIRAQRDLDELVLNDHVTEVRRRQTNHVHQDQIEEVRRNQSQTVRGRRTSSVWGDEVHNSLSNHRHSIGGSNHVVVNGHYELSVSSGSALVAVDGGEYVAKARRAVVLAQNDERFIEMTSDEGHEGILIDSKGATIRVAENKIELKVGASSITIEDGGIRVNNKSFPSASG